MSVGQPRDEDDDESGTDTSASLPVLHKSERTPTAIERLVTALRRTDGPLSVSTATVPSAATDVGDVDVRATPRASDLGYPEGYTLAIEDDPRSGQIIVSDPPHWRLAGETHIRVSEGDLITDVSRWA